MPRAPDAPKRVSIGNISGDDPSGDPSVAHAASDSFANTQNTLQLSQQFESARAFFCEEVFQTKRSSSTHIITFGDAFTPVRASKHSGPVLLCPGMCHESTSARIGRNQ